jgi:hypothetical protein
MQESSQNKSGKMCMEESYLGFTLTSEGIKRGKNKLKAIKDAKPPTDIKPFSLS